MKLFRAKQPGDMSAAWLLLPLALLVLAVVFIRDGVDVDHFMTTTLPMALVVFVIVGTVLRLLWWLVSALWAVLSPR